MHDRKPIPASKAQVCTTCGAVGWKSKTSAETYVCLQCRRSGKGPTHAACEHCGDTFKTVTRSDGRRTRFCSKSCARKSEMEAGGHPFVRDRPMLTDEQRAERLRIKGERARRSRRARLAGVASEPYTTATIAERDGRRCGLCHKRVNMARRWPSPESPSVDHIVPLSQGGDDTKANVQLAHFGCNLKKAARVKADVQLRLIG